MKTPVSGALVLVLLLAGCGGGGGSTGNDVQVSGTGIAIGEFNGGLAALGPFVYFLASEFAQAGLDLNADADAADNVAHVIDVRTGAVTNLAVAGRAPIVSGDVFAGWVTSEVAQGATDATGDGDFADNVLVVHDPALPLSVTNPRSTGVNVAATTPLAATGSFFGFVTAEFDLVAIPAGPPITPPYPIGVDLNVDGDFDDAVFRVYDAASGTLYNTGLAWTGGAVTAMNGLIAFVVSETANGGQDLNLDGDNTDEVLFVFDTRTLMVHPVGPGAVGPRAIDPSHLIVAGTTAAPLLVYAITEAGEGGMSFNFNPAIGDTDASDFVIAIYDVNTQTESFPYQGIAVDPLQTSVSGSHVAFVAREAENGTGTLVDFNADGDSDDEVVFWVSLAAPSMAVNTGIAAAEGESRLTVRGSYIVFLASESAQGAAGTNYNAATGDDDRSDNVPFYFDLAAAGSPGFNTQLASTDFLCFDDFFIIVGDEAANDGFDLSEDGDANDRVPVFFGLGGPVPARASDPIVADGLSVVQVCPSYIRIFSNSFEGQGFGDVNEDGDEDDYFLNCVRVGRASGNVLNNQWLYSTDDDGASIPFVAGPGAVFFPFLEQVLGTGLNANAAAGDADLSDRVLFWVATECF